MRNHSLFPFFIHVKSAISSIPIKYSCIRIVHTCLGPLSLSDESMAFPFEVAVVLSPASWDTKGKQAERTQELTTRVSSSPRVNFLNCRAEDFCEGKTFSLSF